jgi:hypothetical protein
MYPIDFSEGKKKKSQPAFEMPKLTAQVWAVLAVPVVIGMMAVLYFDYSAVSKADDVIMQMEALSSEDGSHQKKEMRRIAGVSPDTDVRGGNLHETYVFDRVIPVFPKREITVVYSSSGKVVDVFNAGQSRDFESASYN